MLKITIVSSIVFLFSVACQSQGLPKESSGELAVTSKYIYPKYRVWTTPSDGEEVAYNPPSLQWPVVKNAKYSVRLSTSKDFTKDVIEKENIPFALYNPHQKLEEGVWYWQLKVNNEAWGKVDFFNIASSAKDFATPDVEEITNGMASSHPRVLVKKKDLNAFRKRSKGYKESAILVAVSYTHLTLPTIYSV